MPAKLSKIEIGERCHRQWEEADKKRMAMSGVFSSLRDYARPSIDNVISAEPNTSGAKSTQKHTRLYDSTLMNSVEQHASGIKAWMSPANSFWFEITPHEYYEGNERVKQWHHTASQIMERLISRSNFHAEDFEAIVDGAAFGTRALLITELNDPNTPFVCRRYDPSAIAILEDEHGRIGEIYITQNFTAKQAVAKFGAEDLPKEVTDRFREKPHDPTEDKYILCIYTRGEDEYDSQLITSDNKPIASNWMHEKTKTLVRMSGFDEMPVIVSRHQKWGGTPFGIPPAVKALADARQLNLLQCSLDLAIDIAVNPRLLIPVELEGNINITPGGATFYASENRLPKVWGELGTYQDGESRVRMRRQDIERALNLDVFRTFRNITKEITATEAIEIRQEAIDLFSPVFSLMSTEHYERALQRMFNIALRAGYIPEPPEDMLIQVGENEVTILPPKVTFTSRMAMAISQRHKAAIDESLQRRANVAQFLGPAAFDDLKVAQALKLIDQGNGLPFFLQRTEEEIAQIQQARAEEQARQEERETIETMAAAAGKAKGTKLEEAANAELGL